MDTGQITDRPVRNNVRIQSYSETFRMRSERQLPAQGVV
jgi:hypothetical protein